jgi:hypothetical protein
MSIMSPAVAGPFGVLLIFGLAYVLFFGVVAFFLFGISYLMSHISVVLSFRKPYKVVIFKDSCKFAFIIAAAPIMLIALGSIGHIEVYEYLLVLFFVFIGCLYISKRIH